MLKYRLMFPTCMHTSVKDLTEGKGEHRNWWCPVCETHWFKGKEYTPDEWDAWLES
jgi:hypothetical protein